MQLDHMVILASDLKKSVSFYGAILSVLGFSQTREWVWLNDSGFAIDLRKASSNARYDRYGPGLNHIGFSVESFEELDSIRIRMMGKGIGPADIQSIDSARCLFIPDPDGLRVEIAWEPKDV